MRRYTSILSRLWCSYAMGASKRQASISQTARTPSGYGNTADRNANLRQRNNHARCKHKIPAIEDKTNMEVLF